MVQDGEVLAVGVGIADYHIENGGVEQLQDVECGPKGDSADKAEAVFKRRASSPAYFNSGGTESA